MSTHIARLLAFAVVIASASTWAQEFPSKPLRMVVGFQAGAGVDVSGRIVGQFLSESLGQPAVVENRPGLASMIAARDVAKAALDGHIRNSKPRRGRACAVPPIFRKRWSHA